MTRVVQNKDNSKTIEMSFFVNASGMTGARTSSLQLSNDLAAANHEIERLQQLVAGLKQDNDSLNYKLKVSEEHNYILQQDLSYALMSNAEQAAEMAAIGTLKSDRHELATTQRLLESTRDELEETHAELSAERTAQVSTQQALTSMTLERDATFDLLYEKETYINDLHLRMAQETDSAQEQIFVLQAANGVLRQKVIGLETTCHGMMVNNSPLSFAGGLTLESEDVGELRRTNAMLMSELLRTERGVRKEVEEALKFYGIGQ